MEKRKEQEKNNQKKKEVMDMFDRMVKNANSISVEEVSAMFPDDHDLVQKIIAMKQKSSMQKSF